MSPSLIEPDPDLSAADPAVGQALDHAIAALGDQGVQVLSQLAKFGDAAWGATPSAVAEQLRAAGEDIATRRDNLRTAADYHRAAVAAAAAFRANAPTPEEIGLANEAAREALRVLLAASGGPAQPQARAAWVAASKRSESLHERRHAAIEAYEAWDRAAAAELPTKLSPVRPTQLGRHDAPTPTPAASTPASGSRTPAPATGTRAPQTGWPVYPGEALASSAPAASPAFHPAAASGAAAATPNPDVTALLAQLLRQPAAAQAAPVAQQQPQVAAAPMAMPMQAPALSAPATGAGRPRLLSDGAGNDDVVDEADIDAMLGGATATLAAPAITPGLTPVLPAPHSAMTGPAGTAPVPAPPPLVSGSSADGLTTSANVTGRVPGDVRTALSIAAPEIQRSPAPATGPVTGTQPGMGMPMGAPMMPPMGGAGGPGGGPGLPRKDPSRPLTEDELILTGAHVIAAAVPGGTILQRDRAGRGD